MALLMDYHWPGNIRELQNVIERSAILSKSEIIEVDDALVPVSIEQVKLHKDSAERAGDEVDDNKQADNARKSVAYRTLAENEKRYIISVLNDLNWLIWGKRGCRDSGCAGQHIAIQNEKTRY